jgi:hypothetical protein
MNLTRRANHRHNSIVARFEPAPETVAGFFNQADQHFIEHVAGAQSPDRGTNIQRSRHRARQPIPDIRGTENRKNAILKRHTIEKSCNFRTLVGGPMRAPGVVDCLRVVSALFLCAAQVSGARADSSAAQCSAKVRKFVAANDLLLTEDRGDILAYYDPIRTYLNGTRGCNVDEVLSIVKNSKFLSELNEHYTNFVIVFQGKTVIVSFGLKKDTGNIETPAAYGRYASF